MSITELSYQAASIEDAPVAAIQGRSQWQLTWRRLRSDKVAIGSIVVIILVIAFAPRGISGILLDLRHRLRSLRRAAPASLGGGHG